MSRCQELAGVRSDGKKKKLSGKKKKLCYSLLVFRQPKIEWLFGLILKVFTDQSLY
jgi:hypothetical protein